MKKTQKQKERIIENIYDIILQTPFEKEAKLQMKKDLANKNIMVDKEKGIIEIQNQNGDKVQYLITIT